MQPCQSELGLRQRKKKTQCTTTEFRDRKPLSRVTRPAPLPRHLQLSPSQLHLLHTISCARSRQRTQTSLASLSLSTVDGVRFPVLISSPTSCAKLSLLSPCATTRVAATSSFFTPLLLFLPPPFFLRDNPSRTSRVIDHPNQPSTPQEVCADARPTTLIPLDRHRRHLVDLGGARHRIVSSSLLLPPPRPIARPVCDSPSCDATAPASKSSPSAPCRPRLPSSRRQSRRRSSATRSPSPSPRSYPPRPRLASPSMPSRTPRAASCFWAMRSSLTPSRRPRRTM